MKKPLLFLLTLLLLSSVFIGSVLAETPSDQSAHLIENMACSDLVGMEIPAADIGLPTTGATITSASLKIVNDLAIENAEYCEVLGAIHPVDPTAPDINFQVNLPINWNRKVLQFGGGGFNGTVVTGLGNISGGDRQPRNTPLAQGYVTFGSDSGHVADGPWDGRFAMNDEALANFAADQLKKTKDVALALVKAQYDRTPDQVYFAGGSEGGREGLIIVQRFPDEYNGVIAFYPVLNWIPKAITDNRNARALYANDGAGWISPDENTLINETVLEACDTLDGVDDGVISNITACAEKEDEILNALRCPGASNGEACLSEEQIEVVKTFNAPMHFDFPLANGFASMPGYSQLQGADIGSRQFGARAIPSTPLDRWIDGAMGVYADQVIRYKVIRDPDLNTQTFDPNEYSVAFLEASRLLDATNPDISEFRENGGKLILLHGTTDEVVTPYGTIDYYNALVDTFGQNTLDQFVKFYMVPGYGHGGGAFTVKVDLLEELDTWIMDGEAPSDLVVADQNSESDDRTRPLCEYPTYPQYNGSGDVNSAASFTCIEPGENGYVSASDIQALVTQFKADGAFANDSVARSLDLHLTAVNLYEEKELGDKVVKHMGGFNRLLDHQKDNALISESAYHTLRAYAGNLIQKWQ